MSDSKPPPPRQALKHHKPQSHINIYNFKDTLNVKNRINPEITTQLNNNPYTQTYGYYKKKEPPSIVTKNNRPKFRAKLDVMEDYHDSETMNRKIKEEIDKL